MSSDRVGGCPQRTLWGNRGHGVGAICCIIYGKDEGPGGEPKLRTPQEEEHSQLGLVRESVSTCTEAALGVKALLSGDGHKVL